MSPRHPSTRSRALLAGAAVLASLPLLRTWSLQWGAREAELDATLPGDELLPGVDHCSTRAVTILAAPQDVWPWLVQLGQDRGGFYSYDAVENLLGLDIHSADRIDPAWQDLTVGDEVLLAPGVPLTVAVAERDRALVLRTPAGGGPGAPYDFTWAFVLQALPDSTTRLVVRERYAYRSGWSAVVVEPVSLVSFVMSQRMLRGIRDRAETAVSAAGAHRPGRG
ncbi:SRPBCC family protein [Cellulomonas soli]